MEMDLSHALDVLADQGRRLREQWRFDWPEQSQQTACALRFHLRAGSPPTLVAVVGGASSGKSTVFNNLLEGHMASRVTARGHATLGPIMATCEQDRPRVESWLAEGLLMPGLPRKDAQLDEEIHGAVDGLSTIYHPFDSLANIILFDLPDFTSEAAAREGDITLALLPWFDKLLIVVDHERWFDRQSISKLRAASTRYEQKRLVLFNRTLEQALLGEDRAALQQQADRLAADGMVVLEFRRGRGFCRFAPGTLDEAAAFAGYEPPNRRTTLLARVRESATDVLNQNEERSARLDDLGEAVRAAADRAVPDVHECMQALMISAERKQLQVVSRVLRIDGAKQWMQTQTKRIRSALGRLPVVGLAIPSLNRSPESPPPDESDREAVGVSFFESVARKQIHDIQRAAGNSGFWHEIRRWTGCGPRTFDFSWSDEFRSDVVGAVRQVDSALCRWTEKVEAECQGVSPNIHGAVGAGAIALGVILVAVPGPVAALTLVSAKGAIGAALTKLAAAAGAGALFGKHAGRLSAVLAEKLVGCPEFDAVRDSVSVFRDHLASFGRRQAEAIINDAVGLVIDEDDPLAAALKTLQDASEATP